MAVPPDAPASSGKPLRRELDSFCADDYAQMWQDMQVDDPLHSPAMARLRRAHVRAQAVSLAVDTAQQPSTALPAAQPQLNSWAEHAPPRLDASVIAQLAHHKDFKTSYPGEFLDSDAMPSVRLLSITQMVCPARRLKCRSSTYAIAFCTGALLARLKALDKKVLNAATQNPADPSLRTVTTTELVAADRQIWHEIALLHRTGWTLDDALHELTTIRAD
ncbi:unnamed protein product, partial [Symbiodinium sp. KB8]